MLLNTTRYLRYVLKQWAAQILPWDMLLNLDHHLKSPFKLYLYLTILDSFRLLSYQKWQKQDSFKLTCPSHIILSGFEFNTTYSSRYSSLQNQKFKTGGLVDSGLRDWDKNAEHELQWHQRGWASRRDLNQIWSVQLARSYWPPLSHEPSS